MKMIFRRTYFLKAVIYVSKLTNTPLNIYVWKIISLKSAKLGYSGC